VSYEEAFEAMQAGDYHAAVPLLEKAARQTGYTSDIIINAYTLALYRTGDKKRLADVAFDFANSMVEHDPGSALDYFQRAITAGLDSKLVRRVGEIFEKWAEPPGEIGFDRPVRRVAHVIGCLIPSQSSTQYLKMLVSSLKRQGIESTIFTTESGASWFFNAAAIPQSQQLELEAEVKSASVEGDFVERAQRIADAIRKSGIPVAFFHSGLEEQITARVAAMRPSPIQINVNHAGEMDADIFDGRIHLFQNGLERTRFGSAPAEWIPPASDIESRLQMSEPVTRDAMGLQSAATVSATFGNLNKAAGPGYLRALSEILTRFSKHFHLFAGTGDVKAIRPHLHAQGVLPRVRFLGNLGDVAPLLNVVDVYLAPFPKPTCRSVLEAMGAGKPVVALRVSPDSQSNSAAELVGARELTAPGEANYIEIVDRLLRNSALREQQGQAMRDRFRSEFRPDRLGERYKQFLERL
jgi:hypothetical protein